MDNDEQYDTDSTGSTGDLELIEPQQSKKCRVFSEKARIALNNGREAHNAMRRQRKLDNEIKVDEARLERLKQYEDNITRKALAIRKREIKNDYLTLIEDDDTPNDIIQEMAKALTQRRSKTPHGGSPSGNQIPQHQNQIPQVQQKQPPQFIFV